MNEGEWIRVGDLKPEHVGLMAKRTGITDDYEMTPRPVVRVDLDTKAVYFADSQIKTDSWASDNRYGNWYVLNPDPNAPKKKLARLAQVEAEVKK